MKRRDFVKHGAVTGLGLAGAGLATGATLPSPLRAALTPGVDGISRAQRIIFFAYDGLTWEDIGLARYYAQHNRDRVLELERLLATGASGAMLTHSLTAVVTDSSAAATAWSVGRKVVNNAVCQYPDGTPLTTVLHLAKDRGLGTGLVSSARITHATPASWWAQIRHRDLEDEIADQYLESGMDVLLGGGEEYFLPEDRDDGRNLFAEFGERGYQVLRTSEELSRVTGDQILGVFTRGHVAYEIDRKFQNAPSPSLADMTRAGLNVLDGNEQGFVLQIEAGRVDHANHENDPGGTLHDILAADEALKVTLDYADRTPGTLVIMASDHGTGPGALFGRGPGYRNSTEALQEIDRQRASYASVRSALRGEVSIDQVQSTAAELLGVRMNAEDAERVARVLRGEERLGHRWAHGNQPLNSLHQALSQASPVEGTPAATPRQELGASGGPGLRVNVNYASGAHVAGPVPLALYGAGVSQAGLGIVDNTDLFDLMLHALGISFQNPLMNEEEALRVSVSMVDDEADRPHWV